MTSIVEDVVEDLSDGRGPSVHLQSRLRFRRPAMGVSGAESLSDSEESRLSPAWGPRGLIGPSEEDWSEDTEGDGVASDDDEDALIERDMEGESESEDAGTFIEETSIEDTVESEVAEDWRSECAMVYFVVLISSSRGVRNDTFFSAGNIGRTGAILRGIRF